MSKKVSNLSDMAKLAGVSESTVSRALNDSQLISAKTRERIQSLAQEVGFSINTSARNLRLQKSNTIAVILLISSEQDQSTTDPFILGLLGVIAEQLTQRGYDMLLASHNTQNTQWLTQYFDSKRADGVIIFGQGDNAEIINSLASRVPMIVWGAEATENKYLTVGTDNRLGGQLATEHLIEQGCKNIVFAGQLSFETSLRYEGYQAATAQHHLPSLPAIPIHFTYQDAYQVCKRLLNEGEFNYDGICAASDTIALGISKALREHAPHHNIAIVGYDDIPVAAFTHPSLTTIKQDTQSGGKELVERLFKLINKEPTESHLLNTKLIQRESSKREQI